MKVLQSGNSLQTLRIIPRIYSSYVILEVRNESTKKSTTYDLQTTISNDYLQIINSYNLEEGFFYELKIFDVGEQFIERINSDNGIFEISSCFYDFYRNENNIIYKDKIFCTNQTVNQENNQYYSINLNNYVQTESNNDYIILNE